MSWDHSCHNQVVVPVRPLGTPWHPWAPLGTPGSKVSQIFFPVGLKIKAPFSSKHSTLKFGFLATDLRLFCEKTYLLRYTHMHHMQ